MKNIFNQLDPTAPNHRNAYDLSQRHLYSAKVGQKLPVCCIDTLPGDYFDVDCLSLVRSMPINTAAFTRLKCTFEFVFVPYQQLWHGWNQFFLQNEENMSSGDSFEHGALPRFNLIELIRELLFEHLEYLAIQYVRNDSSISVKPSWHDAAEYFGSPIVDSFNYDKALGAFRLLDLLGYGAFYNLVDSCDKYLSSPSTQNSISTIIAAAHGEWETALDNLDTLFHTFLYNVFLPSSVDSVHGAISPEKRWMYEPDPNNPRTSSYLRSLWVNPFRILAYNKAWQDYTMNKRVQRYDPEFFNVDASNVIQIPQLLKILGVLYESWDYDFFTGVFTSPQEGDVSLISGNSSIFLSPAPSSQDGDAVFQRNTGKLIHNGYSSSVTSVVGPSVYDIKRAEFLQRWKENHLRAGTKSQKQAVSQWNTHFRYLSDEYSDFITSFDMVVNIDEVINTADDQGDISGKGIGTGNGKFSYKASDAGVIVCLMSIKPRPEYDATMIDKSNTCLQPFDYPSPFFDNLGLEAVPSYLLNLQHFTLDGYENEVPIGYSVRYLPWKSAIDKVHGAFMSSYYTKELGAGSLSVWATPRKELANANYKRDIDTLFYVNPNVVDPIFAGVADSTQETDHFIFNTNFLVRVVRNLSVSGMPTWNV